MRYQGNRRSGRQHRRRIGSRGAVLAVAALIVAAGTVAVADSEQLPFATERTGSTDAAAPVDDAAATTPSAPAAGTPTATPGTAKPGRTAAAGRTDRRTAKAPPGLSREAARNQCATIGRPVGDGGFYDYAPPIRESGDALAGWPERVQTGTGTDAAALGRAGDALSRTSSVRSFVVVRNGKLAYERYYGGSSRQQSNNVHSASKSILQALVGAAIERGQLSLDSTAADVLGKKMNIPASQGRVTVRELLTMTSGLDWVEDRTESEVARSRNWVSSILSRPRSGNRFNYSTGNTHVLSAMLQAATGRTTCELAAETVLGGMGVAPERWARDPQQVSSGGFNLYLTARELTRFGQLYLDDGTYAGKRLIPSSTVTEARTVTDRRQGYSAGWWISDINGVRVQKAWGWGGQFVAVIPSKNMVVTATQDTSRYDGYPAQDIDLNRFLREYVLPATR
ncbi:hypothetical protein GCM10010123_16360 [Pilimelia anulata]|uniref:Beta-lactamase-related domain-containing protein n=1 Tax=Pilimelia anulata TaxID=53371 RepID=A0A8J3B6A1_9ACTN|nr:serine hydrolase [Pilimelia anulata]GGJ87485.1 hypothetical protein GCM10010123_16360 [Pilimelia anulata]